MSTLPNSPTLLREFPTPKPNAAQFVGMNVRAEMGRQQINRTQMAKLLGWTAYKLRSRLSGTHLYISDMAEISVALEMDIGKMFEGMTRDTVRSALNA